MYYLKIFVCDDVILVFNDIRIFLIFIFVFRYCFIEYLNEVMILFFLMIEYQMYIIKMDGEIKLNE